MWETVLSWKHKEVVVHFIGDAIRGIITWCDESGMTLDYNKEINWASETYVELKET